MKKETFRIVNSDAKSNIFSPTNLLFSRVLCERGLKKSESFFSDILIALNHNEKEYSSHCKMGGDSSKTFLVRLEPESVFPKQFHAEVEKKYKRVITPGSVLDYKDNRFFVGWPYMVNQNPAKPRNNESAIATLLAENTEQGLNCLKTWEKRPHLITLIAANKVSPIANSNYGIRRKMSSELPSHALKVYGPLWDDNLFLKIKYRLQVAGTNLQQGVTPHFPSIYGGLLKNYPSAAGQVLDKFEIIRKSKFSLVIENSNEYVSEKIFDAILGGSVPIYIGPELLSVGLPQEMAITKARTPTEVENVIKGLSSSQIQEVLEAGKSFLTGRLFQELWTAESVYKNISKKILSELVGLSG